MTKFTLIVCLSCLALPNVAFAQPPVRSGYDVAWSDEFDGTGLDANRWTASSSGSGGGNFSLEQYLPQQVTVAGGKLVITSDKTGPPSKPYRSGLIETNSTYQKYGRWDVRAKLPGTKGTWPAIWLLSDVDAHPWPSQGEIDIMENRGNEPLTTSSAFHYGTNPPYANQFKTASQSQVHNGTQVNYHNSGFHTYSVEWDPEQIRFYVDDVHHWTVRDSDVDGFLTGTFDTPGDGVGPSGVGPMRLIINTAIGGTFFPEEEQPDGSSVWPQTLEVDYVHAYTKSASAPVLTFENGGFEDQGGSLAHWSKFGDGGFNVSIDNVQTGSGSETLKLYGQFNGDPNYSGVQQGISVTAGDDIRAAADAFVAAGDSLAGTANQLELKIDYFSELHGLFGSSEHISSEVITLANGGSSTNQWFSDEILSTAPAGAVEARVGLVFTQIGNAGGSVYVDNVEFEVTSDPQPSLASFTSDFDSLTPGATIGDGWLYINTDGPNLDYGGDAPNGPQICTLNNNGAGNQFLNMFADYGNPLMPTTALTLNVFQEQTFTAADSALGETWTFNFDYARADDPFGPGGATTTGAFIRVYDGALNLLSEEVFPTTAATGPAFAPGSASLTFDPAWINGGIVRFGFTSTVINYQSSGVYYDNVNFSPVVSPPFVPGDANADGVVNNFDIAAFGLALFQPAAYAVAFPGVDPDVVLDMNNDGVLNNFDISGFGTALGF